MKLVNDFHTLAYLLAAGILRKLEKIADEELKGLYKVWRGLFVALDS